MTIQDFINQHNGQSLDFDGYYGAQCVDLVQFWSQALGGPRFTGNAADLANQTNGFWTWVPNSPTGVPPAGAVMVWDGGFNGGPGHTGIAVSGNTNTFDAFVQNDPGGPNGGPAHVKTYNYNHVAGWLVAPQVAAQGEEDMISADDVDNLYRQLLGRPGAGDPGMQNWVGKSWHDAYYGIKDSDEGKERTQNLLDAAAERGPLRDQLNAATAQIADLQKQITDLKTQLAKAGTPVDTKWETFKALIRELIK